MLDFLFITYIMANIALYLYWAVVQVERIADNGFYVKHLVWGIIFLPATLAVLAMLITFAVCDLIWKGVTKLGKAKFFSKRLF